MNQWFMRLASMLLVIGVLAGCSTDSNSSGDSSTGTEEKADSKENTEQNEETVVITLSKDNGEEVIDEKEVPIKENAILFDVMKENFEVEDDQGFITSIDGIAPEKGEEKSWMFFINDEMALVGAKEIELSAGDKVTFDLQAWE